MTFDDKRSFFAKRSLEVANFLPINISTKKEKSKTVYKSLIYSKTYTKNTDKSRMSSYFHVGIKYTKLLSTFALIIFRISTNKVQVYVLGAPQIAWVTITKVRGHG